jgi:hypothetical protein
LVNSNQFKRLRILDLHNQTNLTDEHIKILSENKYYKRLEEINLRTTSVTKLSIDYIGKGKFIGCEREYPCSNSKYNSMNETKIKVYTDIKYDEDELAYFGIKVSINPPHFILDPIPNIKIIKIIN